MMKIKRILIANRGEIAVRIMKTAHLMKIETVVVKTAIEPYAMYLTGADVIFDNSEDNSEIPVFLNIEKLIAIALETKANAIHPGYGFLSENPGFAEACAAAANSLKSITRRRSSLAAARSPNGPRSNARHHPKHPILFRRF